VLCGIGFTMSLFIASLAYQDPLRYDEAVLGILGASVLSALLGYLWLRMVLPGGARTTTSDEARPGVWWKRSDRTAAAGSIVARRLARHGVVAAAAAGAAGTGVAARRFGVLPALPSQWMRS
jgi:hypothetical protein